MLENFFDFDQTKLEQFDTVLIHSREKSPLYIDFLIDTVAVTHKKHLAVVMIFDDAKDQRNVLSNLAYWEEENMVKVWLPPPPLHLLA